MESTETALVLKVGKFREVDAWVRLFSPRQGVFTAFAFGGCVSRRRFCGCLDPFNLVRFKLKKDRKGYATLLEGALMEGHSRLRREGERLGMAVNCLKFVEAAHIGPTGSQAAYALLTDTLAALDGQEPPTRLLPLFFRARMAFDQGFRPELATCAVCGSPLERGGHCLLFVEEGRMRCPDCRRTGRGAFAALGREALDALRAVSAEPPAVWAHRDVSAQARMELARALDLFVSRHLGLTWRHGSFTRI
ncbi:DNA repair protein RecO [Fundidesulfovibrio butyratiphilus]